MLFIILYNLHLCIFLFTLVKICDCLQHHKVQKRALLFPPTTPTRAQIIYGIGVPLDLDTESLTTGYVLKAEYFLPTKIDDIRFTELHPMPINRRSLSLNNTEFESDQNFKSTTAANNKYSTESLSEYRWAIYKGIETIIDRAGLVGRACMLRSICEAAEIPFHYHSGLLGEFLHILMTPSSSSDPVIRNADNAYFHAEMFGRTGGSCEIRFNECKGSILDQISGVHIFTEELLKLL